MLESFALHELSSIPFPDALVRKNPLAGSKSWAAMT